MKSAFVAMLTSHYFYGEIWKEKKGERDFYYAITFIIFWRAPNAQNDRLTISDEVMKLNG